MHEFNRGDVASLRSPALGIARRSWRRRGLFKRWRCPSTVAQTRVQWSSRRARVRITQCSAAVKAGLFFGMPPATQLKQNTAG